MKMHDKPNNVSQVPYSIAPYSDKVKHKQQVNSVLSSDEESYDLVQEDDRNARVNKLLFYFMIMMKFIIFYKRGDGGDGVPPLRPLSVIYIYLTRCRFQPTQRVSKIVYFGVMISIGLKL